DAATISTLYRTAPSPKHSHSCSKRRLAKRQASVRGLTPQSAASALWEHQMRDVALAASIVCLSILALGQPASATAAPDIDPHASLSVVQQWIYNYRAKPDYAHVPAAVRVLFHAQTFREPENAGIYLGFIAGAIGSNSAKAEQLVNSFFPLPPEDE